jgi:hypothetical protein
VYRVRGIDRPLIALGPNMFGLGARVTLASLVADKPAEAEVPASADPDPLDPALLPYLDWPLYLTMTCEHAWCSDTEDFRAISDRRTVRELLADVKRHAEAATHTVELE